MPIPTLITDLSPVVASNSPAGGDPPGQGDDFLRAHAGFIRQIYDDTRDAVTATKGAGALGYTLGVAYTGATVGAKLSRLQQPQDIGTATASTSFALGSGAMALNTGIGNLALGYQAMPVATTGQFSTSIGINSMLFYTTGLGFTTAVGYGAYARGLTGYNNVAVGFETIHDNGTGTDNVAIGSAALHSGTNAQTSPAPADPSSCVAVGSQAAKFAYGSFNTVVGANAVNSGSYVAAASNVAVGESAFQFITTASQCVGIGRQVALTKTTGNNDTMVGFQAGYSLAASAGFNTFLGSLSGYYCPGSIQSTYVGYLAGQGKVANTGGGQNVGVGASAMELCGDVTSTTAVGFLSLRNVTGSGNTALGASALTAETTGTNNTAVGKEAGATQTTGFSNTTSIGYQANCTASNQVTIGNSSVTQTVIRGKPTFTSIPASVTPANNGELEIQATSNTSLTFKFKGSDGVVRSGSITLT